MEYIKDELIQLSLSMFRKNFLGIFHGSISAKIDENKFIINTKDAIFDELNHDSFITLNYFEDYRYKSASIDSKIHKNIYEEISDAKYISFTFPHNIIACSLLFETFSPIDFFGKQYYPKLKIYDPKNFDTWYSRAPEEIAQNLKLNNIMIIKGYGVYTYDRDIKHLVKKIAILENSAKILLQIKNYLKKS